MWSSKSFPITNTIAPEKKDCGRNHEQVLGKFYNIPSFDVFFGVLTPPVLSNTMRPQQQQKYHHVDDQEAMVQSKPLFSRIKISRLFLSSQ
jgi:hypothetical protein